MRVVHIITGLNVGGAEMMLLRLAERLQPRMEQFVVSLAGSGPVAGRLQGAGVPTLTLGMSPSWPDPLALFRLVRHLRSIKPDVVQTWLYHADLVGGVAARLAGVRALAWNIRNNDLSDSKTKAGTRRAARLLAHLSRRLPARIVCCSHAARDTHVALGYDADRFEIIPNGFDLLQLKPDAGARAGVRAELGLPAGTLLVGLIARFDPQKNHAGFFAAAGRLHRERPGVHFLLAGRGVDGANAQLCEWMQQAGVDSVTHLLGERDDIPRLTAALDVASSCSSWGEAFPNVLGEAMACGVPCVATDAGDAALIIADTGRVVARDDMDGLAFAWKAMLDLPAAERARLGELARTRIAEHFEIGTVVDRYAALYGQMAAQGR